MFASDAARLFEAMGSPAVTGEAVDTFRHWVNFKVLPAIFATGGYILKTGPKVFSMPVVNIRVFWERACRRTKLRHVRFYEARHVLQYEGRP